MGTVRPHCADEQVATIGGKTNTRPKDEEMKENIKSIKNVDIKNDIRDGLKARIQLTLALII
jgi:hypothetical protein